MCAKIIPILYFVGSVQGKAIGSEEDKRILTWISRNPLRSG